MITRCETLKTSKALSSRCDQEEIRITNVITNGINQLKKAGVANSSEPPLQAQGSGPDAPLDDELFGPSGRLEGDDGEEGGDLGFLPPPPLFSSSLRGGRTSTSSLRPIEQWPWWPHTKYLVPCLSSGTTVSPSLWVLIGCEMSQAG